jgi:hypothetical protein
MYRTRTEHTTMRTEVTDCLGWAEERDCEIRARGGYVSSIEVKVENDVTSVGGRVLRRHYEVTVTEINQNAKEGDDE